MPSTRTLSEAYAALGLPEGSTYDEVLSAKNRLLEGAGNNMERKMEVRGGAGAGGCGFEAGMGRRCTCCPAAWVQPRTALLIGSLALLPTFFSVLV